MQTLIPMHNIYWIKKQKNTNLDTVKKVLGVIGTTFLSLILIVIIPICIVATSLVVYVMQFADTAFDVDLKNVELSYTSFIYANDKNGNIVSQYYVEEPVAGHNVETSIDLNLQMVAEEARSEPAGALPLAAMAPLFSSSTVLPTA